MCDLAEEFCCICAALFYLVGFHFQNHNLFLLCLFVSSVSNGMRINPEMILCGAIAVVVEELHKTC